MHHEQTLHMGIDKNTAHGEKTNKNTPNMYLIQQGHKVEDN